MPCVKVRNGYRSRRAGANRAAVWDRDERNARKAKFERSLRRATRRTSRDRRARLRDPFRVDRRAEDVSHRLVPDDRRDDRDSVPSIVVMSSCSSPMSRGRSSTRMRRSRLSHREKLRVLDVGDVVRTAFGVTRAPWPRTPTARFSRSATSSDVVHDFATYSDATSKSHSRSSISRNAASVVSSKSRAAGAAIWGPTIGECARLFLLRRGRLVDIDRDIDFGYAPSIGAFDAPAPGPPRARGSSPSIHASLALQYGRRITHARRSTRHCSCGRQEPRIARALDHR